MFPGFARKEIKQQDVDMHGGTLRELPIDQIERNPDQPRKRFGQVELQKLAASIEATGGVIQPVVVTKRGAGWQIVAGERRWRACQLARLETVLCRIIEEMTERESAQFALLENLDRVELTPVEIGHAYAKLESSHGMTQSEIAQWVGRDRTEVNRYISLTKLPEAVQKKIDAGEISIGHAKVLLGAPEEERTSLAAMCSKKSWSVRRLEKELSKKKETSRNENGAQSLQRMADSLGERIGAVCAIRKSGERNWILTVRASGSAGVLSGTLQRLAEEVETGSAGEGKLTIEIAGSTEAFDFLASK